MAQQLIGLLRRLNYAIAILVGLLFLGCALFVLADIILRQWGSSFGGTDEISGYVMAIATSWGMSFTLLELGHVRIDLLRARAGQLGRSLFDLFSLFVLAACISVIAWQSWPVLARSLDNGSRANTPLETPLAWVQMPWFAGWVWFALVAWLTLISASILVYKGEFAQSERAVGAFTES